MKEILILEHVTKDTIICDQTVLHKALQVVMEHIEDTTCIRGAVDDLETIVDALHRCIERRSLSDELSDELKALLEADRDVCPYLVERLEIELKVGQALDSYLERMVETAEERETSDDAVHGVLECLEFDYAALDKAVLNELERYPAVAEDPKRFGYIAADISKWMVDTEQYQTVVEESIYARSFPIQLASYSIGEIEIELTVDEIVEHVDAADTLPIDSIARWLRVASSDYCIRGADKGVERTHVYMYVTTDAWVDVGVAEEDVPGLVDEYMDQLKDEQRDTLLSRLTDVTIKVHGIDCKISAGMCACCGLEAGKEGSKERYYIFRAGWYDHDGIYMPTLCADLDGNGCLYDAAPSKDEDLIVKGEVIREIAGDDLEGFGDE